MLSWGLRESSRQANSCKRKLTLFKHSYGPGITVRDLKISLPYFMSHRCFTRQLFSEEVGTQIFPSLFLYL